MPRWPQDSAKRLWFFQKSAKGQVLTGKRVMVRSPLMEDFKAWVDLRKSNRAFLEPWEPIWNDDDFSRSSFARRLRIYHDWALRDQGYAFFIFESQSQQLVGAVSLNNIRRGAEQSATLGYWLAERFARQGFMSEVLQLVCDHSFDALNLHRVEAACLPRNEASKRLLEKAGFNQEGYAKSYIKIAGCWEDHLLFARIKTVNRQSPYCCDEARLV